MPRLALVGGLAGLGALTVRADFQLLDWLFVGLLGASCLVLARLKEEFHQFAWLAAGVTAVLFALWIGDVPVGTGGAVLVTALAFGLLFGAGSLHRSARLGVGREMVYAFCGVRASLSASRLLGRPRTRPCGALGSGGTGDRWSLRRRRRADLP